MGGVRRDIQPSRYAPVDSTHQSIENPQHDISRWLTRVSGGLVLVIVSLTGGWSDPPIGSGSSDNSLELPVCQDRALFGCRVPETQIAACLLQLTSCLGACCNCPLETLDPDISPPSDPFAATRCGITAHPVLIKGRDALSESPARAPQASPLNPGQPRIVSCNLRHARRILIGWPVAPRAPSNRVFCRPPVVPPSLSP